MPTGQINRVSQIGGMSIEGVVTRTFDGQLGHSIALPAGTAGTLTTRTDDDTGVATLDSGHGLSTSDVVDVYWDGGMRYGMVATVAGDAITIDLGSGDNLPTQDDAVVVTLQVEINSDFDGDDVQMIVAMCDQRASIDFQDSGDASLAHVELPADEQWDWVADQGIANPLTGNAVDAIHASNSSSTTAATLKIGVGYDSTP